VEALAGRPRLLAALLVLIISALIPVVIAHQRGLIGIQVESRREDLPPSQLQRAGPYLLAAGSVGGAILGVLAASGMFYGLLAVWGRQAGFRAVCAIVTHAYLPTALYGLVSVPILLLREPAEVDLDSPITLSNAAFLISATDLPTLHRVAASLDLFSFWVIGLLTVGLSRLAGRSFGRTLPLVLAPWGLYILVFKALLG
jgi:hypothetical protein